MCIWHKEEIRKGKQIGFVCFIKMHDGEKMVQVFHNVWFGTYKTWETEVRFQSQDEIVGMMNDIKSCNKL